MIMKQMTIGKQPLVKLRGERIKGFLATKLKLWMCIVTQKTRYFHFSSGLTSVTIKDSSTCVPYPYFPQMPISFYQDNDDEFEFMKINVITPCHGFKLWYSVWS